MRVAVVNETLPYPATAGNRIRTLNLIQRLATRHQVTYICRAAESPIETRAGIEHLHKRGIRTVIADWAPSPKRGVAFYGKLASNVTSPLPYAVAAHNSKAMREAIRRMALAREFDLWQFEWLAYADAVADVPDTRTLVIAHNVESLIWKRYAQTEKSALKALYLREQYRKFRSFERRVFGKVSGVVCVSEEDAKLAISEFSPRRVWVVDNGIDRAYFEQANGERLANTILFLGSLEWRPNLDAVKLLLDSIFPEVRRIMPDAKLQIVGRRPPQWLKDAAACTANVELFADVADVRPYLAAASVMAVPLRVGGGSRLKILEGLACGLPVVSTPVGCEGLAIRTGKELSVIEDPHQFAKGLCDAIRRPEESRAMAEAGRRLVYEKYDWDVLANRLETTWDQVIRFSPAKSTWETPAGAQPALG